MSTRLPGSTYIRPVAGEVGAPLRCLVIIPLVIGDEARVMLDILTREGTVVACVTDQEVGRTPVIQDEDGKPVRVASAVTRPALRLAVFGGVRGTEDPSPSITVVRDVLESHDVVLARGPQRVGGVVGHVSPQRGTLELVNTPA